MKNLVLSGAHVAVSDVDAARLTRVTDQHGDQVTAFVSDLRDYEEVQRSAGDLVAQFGRIDILVNNAGVLTNEKLQTTSYDVWRAVHAVNLDAAFLLSQAVVPGMAEAGWGRIVNVASHAAKSGGISAGTAYSTSKSGLIGLTFSMARETASMGITVNALAPAYVMSPMVAEQLTTEQQERILQQIPVGRFCQPDEIAHAVDFLVSPKAGFITGEVIDLNGGLLFD